ncbi:unnamed protein product [Adineta steineri]|uniref:Uncharacterized protein n=1 Tax=Adineta steineri TaxID=433720 RepID=A0A819WAC8_9BILA|nr:unnamed protein product [Adineta steineri]CAF4121079.1 unnamed protein product [Adineta steineri]
MCKGRHCAKCGQCRDWYYTGDQTSWEWIRNVKKWKVDDCKRWNNGDFWQSFKKRHWATCSVNYGGYGNRPGHGPIGICYGHGFLHKGHDIDVGYNDDNDNDSDDDNDNIGPDMYDIRYCGVCLCLCDDNLVQEKEKSTMNEWPDLNTKEVTIVNHLNSLRDGLTEETATKLSKYGSCRFWDFNGYNATGYKNAFKSYLELLLGIAQQVSRSTFLGNFPKDCGGCAVAQFFCIVFMHPTLHSEVNYLLRKLLGDENGRILKMLPDINKMVWDTYKRTDDPFPYAGICLNFGHTSEAYKIANALGAMIKSDTFIQLMKDDTEKGILIAQKMITNLKDPLNYDTELYSLLKDI